MRMGKLGGAFALFLMVVLGSPVHAQPRQLLPRLSRKDVKHRLALERAAKRVARAEVGVDLIPPAPPVAAAATRPAPNLVAAELAPTRRPAAPPRATPAQPETLGEDAESAPEPEPGAEDEYVMGPELEQGSDDQPDSAAPEEEGAPDGEAPETDPGQDDAAPEASLDGTSLDAPEPDASPAAPDEETVHIVVLDGSGFTQVRDIQSPSSGQRRQIVRDDEGRLIEIVRDREGNMLSAQDVGADELPR